MVAKSFSGQGAHGGGAFNTNKDDDGQTKLSNKGELITHPKSMSKRYAAVKLLHFQYLRENLSDGSSGYLGVHLRVPPTPRYAGKKNRDKSRNYMYKRN